MQNIRQTSFFGLEEFLALAFADDAADEAPADQLAQILVRVAAADFEVLHHLVGGEGGGHWS